MFSILLLLVLWAAKLSDPTDQEAFRRWFTYLAEAQYFRSSELPPEINDCAALIRFSYRESFRQHDDAWRNSLGLQVVPSFPSVHGMSNPGVNLFRTGPDTFGQFADAKTLRQWNTRLVSREVAFALPGDLLFYRQSSEYMPFHTMIWIGSSQIDGSRGPLLLYHTGPAAHDRGEIRRMTLDQMTHHPDPRWRPVPGNENFLGVYRWNIL